MYERVEGSFPEGVDYFLQRAKKRMCMRWYNKKKSRKTSGVIFLILMLFLLLTTLFLFYLFHWCQLVPTGAREVPQKWHQKKSRS